MPTFDYLIVGAGLFGATFSWHARRSGKTVLVVEKADHVGGSCYTSELAGVLVHVHGPHIFHTNSEDIWDFVQRFGRFHTYTHRVRTLAGGVSYPLPINLATLGQLWGVGTPAEARAKLESVRVPCASPTNARDWALSRIGPELYALFVEGYARKHWGMDPVMLPPSVVARLPIRLSFDDRYHNGLFQGVPVRGYTPIVEAMLEGCTLVLGVDFSADREGWMARAARTIYTGPIDEFFSHRLGRLGYRSLDIRTQVIEVDDLQGSAQLNQADADVPWLRSVEHKHLSAHSRKHPELGIRAEAPRTVVTWETAKPCGPGDLPFYPMPDAANAKLRAAYTRLTFAEPRVAFGGRLGSYRYLDMDQTIAAAMHRADLEGLT